jgi:hypothetical protein
VPTPPFTLSTPTDGFTVLSLLNSESPNLPPLRNGPSAPPHEPAQHEGFSSNETNPFVYQQAPGQPILWPLEHEQEAMLLQHYIDNVALFVSISNLAAWYLLNSCSLTWSTLDVILAYMSYSGRNKTAP